MSRRTGFIIAILILLLVISIFGGYHFYKRIYFPNITLSSGEDTFLYIKTGSGFQDVVKTLSDSNYVSDIESFVWVAEKYEYPSSVKPGRYKLSQGMSNRELVAMLKSGNQSPVRVIFNNVRLKEQFAGLISKQIEADSLALIKMMNDAEFWQAAGFDTATCISVFIPNTYEFYWNTSAESFATRMLKEYDKFWTESRKEKLKNTGLSRAEVTILASIVEQETKMNDEKPVVAGVYMNRLRKNWKLEADPTLVFASRDFSIRRVLNIHKEIESPYNTYKYDGLPPGPICFPAISSLEAVLNYQKHDYMFFCARDDFSGYHSFARTYNEHLANARRFQNELNRRKIRA